MTDVDVRLITVRPPWSLAIARLGKPVENRTRGTSYRGPVFIHAGRAFDRRALLTDPLRSALLTFGGTAVLDTMVRTGAAELTHPGHVVAHGQLIDCHPDRGDCCGPWAQRSITTPGVGLTVMHHLVLDDVTPLATPIPARGQLGLPWRADPALRAVLLSSPLPPIQREAAVVDGFEDDRAPGCRDCGCPEDVHNAPQFGGGCEVCGIDCDGWR